MKTTLVLPFVASLMVFSCTSMQVTTPGRVSLSGGDQNRAFSAAMQAAQQANLIVKDSDRDSGFIYATKGASALTANAKELFLSINVRATEGGVELTLRSALPGQMVAYGATTKLMEEFCTAFAGIEPAATYEIDGKAFVP